MRFGVCLLVPLQGLLQGAAVNALELACWCRHAGRPGCWVFESVAVSAVWSWPAGAAAGRCCQSGACLWRWQRVAGALRALWRWRAGAARAGAAAGCWCSVRALAVACWCCCRRHCRVSLLGVAAGCRRRMLRKNLSLSLSLSLHLSIPIYLSQFICLSTYLTD